MQGKQPRKIKNLAPGAEEMYKKKADRQKENQTIIQNDYFLPFQGKLNSKNRWLVMSNLIPWDYVEEKYAACFSLDNGAPAKSARLALGCLLIKEKSGFTDEETVMHIQENPYMQAFIGLDHFTEEKIVEPSLFVSFRKRLEGILEEINDMICKLENEAAAAADDDDDDDDDETKNGSGCDGNNSTTIGEKTAKNSYSKPNAEEECATSKVKNEGTMILDATCTPADIAYPTDLGLLNTSREKLENIIDTLHTEARSRGMRIKKFRTYRITARKQYLAVAKQRRPSLSKIRQAIRQQLEHVCRNLGIVDKMIKNVLGDMDCLSKKQHQDLIVLHEVYRQQKEMYDKKSHQIADRIVSISQPHVRPIIRGKARVGTEFGAKIAVSIVNSDMYVDKISWDNFNEGNTLVDSVMNYQRRYGCFPKVVIGDQIYRNRDNFRFCKANGIRLSGKRLGRKSEREVSQDKKQEQEEMRIRNQVEGKFGEGKRRYGLALIMSKLKETSVAEIFLQVMVINLEKRVRLLFCKICKILYIFILFNKYLINLKILNYIWCKNIYDKIRCQKIIAF